MLPRWLHCWPDIVERLFARFLWRSLKGNGCISEHAARGPVR